MDNKEKETSKKMSNTIVTASKDGKRPLSTKPSSTRELFNDDVFGNPLQLSEELKNELRARGLVWRFIDAKRLYDMNGYHDKGWVPYKRDAVTQAKDTHGFKFGNDPDGVIRRGSVILAVKSKEQGDRHKEFLAQKARRATDGYNAKKAQELREFSRNNNLNADVHEGYEDNET